MHELSILKALCRRDTYLQYRNYLSESLFEEKLRVILAIVDNWFAHNSNDLSMEDLANLLFARIPADGEEYKKILSTLAAQQAPESVKTLLEALKRARVCEDISLAAYEASRGSKSVLEVLELSKKLEEGIELPKVEFVTDDLEEILNEIVKTHGLRWRLHSLNQSLGSLRKGDFGFLFARTETGKTTFLASESTYMASQLAPDAGPILWLNNEEQGKKVKLRCYQAALGAKLEHLLREPVRAREKYLDVTKGKILIYDNASISKQQVQALCHQHNPSLIIFDQIDKLSGFRADREDLVMGAIYQWARELAKTYAPVIGVCQANGTGEGVQYLNMSHVAAAQTAKQAEADWILGIGKQQDINFDRVRYLSICKNKLVGDEDTDSSLRHMHREVLLKAEIARYEDME